MASRNLYVQSEVHYMYLNVFSIDFPENNLFQLEDEFNLLVSFLWSVELRLWNYRETIF